MRVVVQRVKNASVAVDGNIISKIDYGLLLLVGFKTTDTTEQIDKMVKKIINLRIFDDTNNDMNLSIKDIDGSILSVSQFTLYASTSKGNRPSFINAMKYDEASKLYDLFNEKLRDNIEKIETGIFGADMKVNLTNDGPVTIIIEEENNG